MSLHTVVEWTIGTTVHKFSFTGISTSSSFYDPVLLNIGNITRETSPIPQDFRVSDATITFDNSDNRFSILKNNNTLRNTLLKIRVIDDTTGSLTDIFTGRVTTGFFSGNEFTVLVRDDSFDVLDNAVRVVPINKTNFPNVPKTTPEAVVPIVYGKYDSTNFDKKGFVPAYLVNPAISPETKYKYVAALGELKSITAVYRYGVLLDPDLYTVTYEDVTIDGSPVRMTFINFLSDMRDPNRSNLIEISYDCQGLTDNNLSTGNVLTNPADIWEDFLIDQAGFSSSDIDATLKSQAQSAYSSKSFEGVLMITEEETLRDVFSRMAESWNMSIFRTGSGKFGISFIDGSTASDPSTLVSIKDQEHILEDSFRIDFPDDIATTLQFSYAFSGARDEFLGRDKRTDSTAVSAVGKDIVKDIEYPYITDINSAVVVSDAKLFLLNEARQIIRASVPLDDFITLQINDHIKVTHFAGPASDDLGYRDKIFRITGLSFDVNPLNTLCVISAVDSPGTTITSPGLSPSPKGTSEGRDPDPPPTPVMGTSLEFDGVDDYIAIKRYNYPANTAVKAFTVEAWIKTTKSTSSIIASYDDSEYWRLGVGTPNTASAGKAQCRINGQAALDLISTTSVDDGNWHHVAAVYDGSAQTFTLYVNGVQEVQKTSADGVPSSFTSTSTRYGFVGVGSEASTEDGTTGPLEWFDGRIDEFRIWSIARTQTEIQRDMRVKLKADTPGLEVYYTFDEGQNAGSILDETRQGRDGIIKSAPKFRLGANSDDIVIVSEVFADKIVLPTDAASETTSTIVLDGTVTPVEIKAYNASSVQTVSIKGDGSGFIGAGVNKITWDTAGNVTVPGELVAGTITAVTFRTQASGQRIEITTGNQIDFYNTLGTKIGSFDTDNTNDQISVLDGTGAVIARFLRAGSDVGFWAGAGNAGDRGGIRLSRRTTVGNQWPGVVVLEQKNGTDLVIYAADDGVLMQTATSPQTTEVGEPVGSKLSSITMRNSTGNFTFTVPQIASQKRGIVFDFGSSDGLFLGIRNDLQPHRIELSGRLTSDVITLSAPIDNATGEPRGAGFSCAGEASGGEAHIVYGSATTINMAARFAMSYMSTSPVWQEVLVVDSRASTHAMRPGNTSTGGKTTVDIGSRAYPWNDIYFSGNIRNDNGFDFKQTGSNIVYASLFYSPTGRDAGLIAGDGTSSTRGGVRVKRRGGATTWPGIFVLEDRNATAYHLYVHTDGNLMISTTPPTTTLVGTVVGEQMSWYEKKNVIGPYEDATEALRKVLETPIYRWKYKEGSVYSDQEFIGVVGYNPDDWFLKKAGEEYVLNEPTLFGHLIMAVKKLYDMIENEK